MQDGSKKAPVDQEGLPPGIDATVREAAGEVDRTLIELALRRTLRERLRAGVSLARLAARFRGPPDRR